MLERLSNVNPTKTIRTSDTAIVPLIPTVYNPMIDTRFCKAQFHARNRNRNGDHSLDITENKCQADQHAIKRYPFCCLISHIPIYHSQSSDTAVSYGIFTPENPPFMHCIDSIIFYHGLQCFFCIMNFHVFLLPWASLLFLLPFSLFML